MSDNTLSQSDLAQLDQMRQDDGAQVQTETTPEPAVQPEPAAEGEGGPPSSVPYARFKEERDRLKEERDRRMEAERRAQVVDQRVEQMLQLVRAQQQPQTPPPAAQQPEVVDLNTDPLRHILTRLEAQERTIGGVTQNMQQAQMMAQQQAQYTQVVQHVQSAVMAAEADFKRATPDYDRAVQYLVEQRDKALEMAGVSDPLQRAQMIQQDALAVSARAIQTGRNAAEMAYQLAQVHGYQPSRGNTEPGQRLQSVQAGQQQARSIGAVSGTGPGAKTADKLYKMSDKEFQEALKDPDWKSLLG